MRYEIGNRDFRPEYSWQADFGFDFATKYVELQASVFANRILVLRAYNYKKSFSYEEKRFFI